MLEVTNDSIKKKLSGKFEYLYPIYEKLRDELASLYPNVRFILKTIYIIIDSDKGMLGVIFWKDDGLHIGLPNGLYNDRILDGKDLKYKGLDYKMVVREIEEIDDFIIRLFEDILRNLTEK